MNHKPRAAIGFDALPADVVTLLPSTWARMTVDDLLPGVRIVHAKDSRDARFQLSKCGAFVLVVGASDVGGNTTASLVGYLRQTAPGLRIVALEVPGALARKALWVTPGGVRLGPENLGDARETLETIVWTAGPKRQLKAIAADVAAVLSSRADLQEIVRIHLERGDENCRIGRFAADLGISEDTLASRTSAAGFLPSALRTWGRLLAAAVLMDRSLMHNAAISALLRFGSLSSFCNTTKRYVGLSPTTWRAVGPLRLVRERIALSRESLGGSPRSRRFGVK